MVLKIFYSVSHEEFVENVERRRIEKKFNSLSDEYVPESERSYNKKYKNLKIDGGKIYERNESRITQLVIKTKNFS